MGRATLSVEGGLSGIESSGSRRTDRFQRRPRRAGWPSRDIRGVYPMGPTIQGVSVETEAADDFRRRDELSRVWLCVFGNVA